MLLQICRRFPVGPIAELPALKRVTVAHQIHHGGEEASRLSACFVGIASEFYSSSPAHSLAPGMTGFAG